MNHKITRTVGCLSAVLLCAPAIAADTASRWYVGVGAGVSKLEPDTNESQYDLDDTQGTSARLFVGRDLSNRLSLELYWADLGEVTLKPKVGAVNPVASPAVEYSVAGVQTLYYFYNSDGEAGRHYRDNFGAYLKLGAGAMDNSSNVEFRRLDDYYFTYGVGLEGLIRSGISWRAELEVFDKDAAQGTISLVKRFGTTDASLAGKAKAASNQKVLDPVTAADAKMDEPMHSMESDEAVKDTVMAAVDEPEMDTATMDEPVILGRDEDPTTESIVAEIEQAIDSSGGNSAVGDGDGDGVVDANDRCPDTQKGLAVDVRGCSFSGIMEGLYFERGSATLGDSSKKVLDNVVLELRRYPNVVLEVQAHTDNRGKAADNLALSQRRAEAVANYMVSRGVSGKRIRARGYGESRPAFRNATEEGRRRNRRVVFKTIDALN